MTVTILEMQRDTAVEFFPELQPYVERALSFDHFNTITIPAIVEQLRRGYARVLLVTEGEQLLAAVVIQMFKATSGERVLHVLAAAGERSSEWLQPLRDKLVEIGKTEGVDSLTMSGRPGWAKKLRALGFRTASIDMRMRIDEDERIIRQQQGHAG